MIASHLGCIPDIALPDRIGAHVFLKRKYAKQATSSYDRLLARNRLLLYIRLPAPNNAECSGEISAPSQNGTRDGRRSPSLD